jgi:hypothetical protein
MLMEVMDESLNVIGFSPESENRKPRFSCLAAAGLSGGQVRGNIPGPDGFFLKF